MQNSAMLNTLAALQSAEAKLAPQQPVEIAAAAKEKPAEVFDKPNAKRAAVVMKHKDLGDEEGKLYEAKEVSLEQLQDPKRKFDLAMWADDMTQARKLAKDLEDRRTWGSGPIVVPPALAPEHDAKVEQQVKVGEAAEEFPKGKQAGDMGKKAKVNQENPSKDAMTKLKASSEDLDGKSVEELEALIDNWMSHAAEMSNDSGLLPSVTSKIKEAEAILQKKKASVKAGAVDTEGKPAFPGDPAEIEEGEDIEGCQVRIYDNGGETIDRYTIVIDHGDGEQTWLGSSEDPFHPQGFGQHVGDAGSGNQEGEHLGKRVKFADVPKKVQQFIEQDCKAAEPTQVEAMARKVTDKIAEAFKAGKAAKSKNTTTDGKSVFLHNNEIVKRRDDGTIEITDAGWPTMTTRERINGILVALGIDSHVYQKGGQQYLNDDIWDGSWKAVGVSKLGSGEPAAEAGGAPAAEAKPAGPRYNLVWKGETIEEDLEEKEANELLQEYNLAYKGGVQKVKAALKAAEAEPVEDEEIAEFEFRYLGLEHEQYFTGFGVAHTEFDQSFVGIGESQQEAAQDAIDMAAQSLGLSEEVGKAMDVEIAKLSDVNEVESEEENAEEGGIEEPSEEASEIHVYVGLLVKTKPKAGAGEGPAHEAAETPAEEAAEHKV